MAKKKLKLTLRNKHWSKQIKGRRYYFGKDYDAAVKRYEAEKGYLELGLPVPGSHGHKLQDLLDEFLSHNMARLHTGELAKRTYNDYKATCFRVADCLPKSLPIAELKPQHFDILRAHLSNGKTKKISMKSYDRELGYARTIFKFASTDNRMIDRPLPYFNALRGVPARQLREEKQSLPNRILTAADIHCVLSVASIKFTAIILLGINGGYNNSDIAHLPLSLLDPIPDLLDYPRYKNYLPRQTPLWPETKKAIANWIAIRPACDRDELFVTAKLNAYWGSSRNDQIGKSFYRYLKNLKIYEAGKNFGALRTTFGDTIKAVGDDTAAKALMGHVDGSMLYTNYAQGVYVPRLKKCTDHVRKWLNKKKKSSVAKDVN